MGLQILSMSCYNGCPFANENVPSAEIRTGHDDDERRPQTVPWYILGSAVPGGLVGAGCGNDVRWAWTLRQGTDVVARGGRITRGMRWVLFLHRILLGEAL